jgi:hypothetical protein
LYLIYLSQIYYNCAYNDSSAQKDKQLERAWSVFKVQVGGEEADVGLHPLAFNNWWVKNKNSERDRGQYEKHHYCQTYSIHVRNWVCNQFLLLVPVLLLFKVQEHRDIQGESCLHQNKHGSAEDRFEDEFSELFSTSYSFGATFEAEFDDLVVELSNVFDHSETEKSKEDDRNSTRVEDRVVSFESALLKLHRQTRYDSFTLLFLEEWPLSFKVKKLLCCPLWLEDLNRHESNQNPKEEFQVGRWDAVDKLLVGDNLEHVDIADEVVDCQRHEEVDQDSNKSLALVRKGQILARANQSLLNIAIFHLFSDFWLFHLIMVCFEKSFKGLKLLRLKNFDIETVSEIFRLWESNWVAKF